MAISKRAREPRSPARVVHESRSFDGDELRVVVVADTHGKPHASAAEHIAAQRPHCILHAGDIGDLRVLDRLAAIAPVHAVRGNIDGHGETIPDVRVLRLGDAQGDLLTLLLMHIAVNGPRLRADALRLAKAHDASIVVCGHSHVPFLGRDREVVAFNPGSIGPRRFQLPILFGVMRVARSGVQLQHIDCETGLPWTPGPPRLR